MHVGVQSTSRLTFGAVSAVPEGAGLLVGDVNTGTFLALPEVGAVAFRELAAGRTCRKPPLRPGVAPEKRSMCSTSRPR
jgi:hypothetical protein